MHAQDMGMGGQVYDRDQIENMYGKGGENFPGDLATRSAACVGLLSSSGCNTTAGGKPRI